MRYRLLGRTGLRVSEVFFGAMTFYERGAEREFQAMLDAYIDAGGNVIDTASAYGESEAILGELLGDRRDSLVVATKYTLTRDQDDPNASGNHRKNMILTLEQSLRRLRTDYIDLYWVHSWDRHTPIEETMRALDDAVRAGKVRYVGISNAPAWLVSRANTLAEWRGWSAFAALQMQYSLLQRDVERELLPMAEAFGLTIAAWAPLARGMLAGKLTGAGAAGTGGRGKPEDASDRDRVVARVVQEVADELGVTSAQVALAWLWHRSPRVHPIIGASSAAQVKDNVGAAGVDIPVEATRRLADATAFTNGYPHDFIDECADHPFVYGTKRVTPAASS
ncbi:aldo/keto reductase [Kibdelosporangium phytohabitans]|uniref:Aldo/keto reductase n=1 Tax=Kibdelosporangium phytohabitans TaxID=860235 RepID=A0A0N9I825_9PSEU|nr:aldo/keto reductase [Kibdelosporangium phytohabitans]ALG15098.1 aldo/keto reductase [Kibdelosporangium phytohabitans]MBE1461098.1 aryl-alcohol dehydrogenase-like predicted oxidoreductase [Kibdelosporangium phytohabitans]